MKKIYWFLLSITTLIPLGLLSENPAWGEWENEYYKEYLGFIPKGIENGSLLEAPIPDYSTSFLGDIGSYYFSAILGIVSIFALFFVLKRVVKS
jgi:cobalt/nickel transport protein